MPPRNIEDTANEKFKPYLINFRGHGLGYKDSVDVFHPIARISLLPIGSISSQSNNGLVTNAETN